MDSEVELACTVSFATCVAFVEQPDLSQCGGGRHPVPHEVKQQRLVARLSPQLAAHKTTRPTSQAVALPMPHLTPCFALLYSSHHAVASLPFSSPIPSITYSPPSFTSPFPSSSAFLLLSPRQRLPPLSSYSLLANDRLYSQLLSTKPSPSIRTGQPLLPLSVPPLLTLCLSLSSAPRKSSPSLSTTLSFRPPSLIRSLAPFFITSRLPSSLRYPPAFRRLPRPHPAPLLPCLPNPPLSACTRGEA